MIREERNPIFWQVVSEHPAVSQGALLGSEVNMAGLVKNDRVIPLAAEHGGYLFIQLDGVGRVFELHSMFTPDGWGREAMLAAVEAFDRIFEGGAQIVTTYEVEGNPRSAPPIRFGFRMAGDFGEALGHQLRSWVLTAEDWRSRPSKLGVN